jgi:hypothetical protein
MYEGEVVLAEQADRTVRSKDEITPQQGEWWFVLKYVSCLGFYSYLCFFYILLYDILCGKLIYWIYLKCFRGADRELFEEQC